MEYVEDKIEQIRLLLYNTNRLLENGLNDDNIDGNIPFVDALRSNKVALLLLDLLDKNKEV